MRFRYPNVVSGSIAASAPILSVVGDAPRDSFFQHVTAVGALVCMYFCGYQRQLLLFTSATDGMESGDGAGNTVDENSGIFSLIQMC